MTATVREIQTDRQTDIQKNGRQSLSRSRFKLWVQNHKKGNLNYFRLDEVAATRAHYYGKIRLKMTLETVYSFEFVYTYAYKISLITPLSLRDLKQFHTIFVL